MAEGRVYSAEFTMTKDSYLKMNRDLRGQRMRRASLVLLSVMILAGSGLVYKDIPVAGWFLVTGGLCMPALMQISWRNSVRRQYDSAKMAHDLTSPDAKWELFEGCRHMCYADDTPRYLNVLGKWMEEQDSGNI